MEFVQCKNCDHFRMWEGDPCCLEPEIGLKLILPDTMTVCDRFVEVNKKFLSGVKFGMFKRKTFLKGIN